LFWTGQKTNQILTCDITYTALRLRSWENTPARVHRTLEEHALGEDHPTCVLLPSLVRCRIARTQLCPTHVYIKVNLLHTQCMTHFSQHFLHTLSQFHYWLEHRSANVCAVTPRFPINVNNTNNQSIQRKTECHTMKVRKTTRRGGWIVFLETSSFTF